MQWHELMDQSEVPKRSDILEFLGPAGPVWVELTRYILQEYQVKPQLSYSHSSYLPGWFLQYQQNGQTLCNIYPRQDYFVTLIVVHREDEDAVKGAVENEQVSSIIRDLYCNSILSSAGRWLMIEVESREVLTDITRLLTIKTKPNKNPDA